MDTRFSEGVQWTEDSLEDFYGQNTISRNFVNRISFRGLSWIEDPLKVIYRKKAIQKISVHRRPLKAEIFLNNYLPATPSSVPTPKCLGTPFDSNPLFHREKTLWGRIPYKCLLWIEGFLKIFCGQKKVLYGWKIFWMCSMDSRPFRGFLWTADSFPPFFNKIPFKGL